MTSAPKPFQSSEDIRLTKNVVLVGAELLRPMYAWLVVEGTIKQYDIRPNGSEVIVNIYRPGAVLALTWLLGDSTNHFFFAAETNAVVKKIPAKQYKEYLQDNPSAAFEVLSKISKGFDGIFSRLAVNSNNDALSRVLHELSIEIIRFGTCDADGVYVQISVQKLADRTGLARETVSRSLARLATDKKITRNKNKIRLI